VRIQWTFAELIFALQIVVVSVGVGLIIDWLKFGLLPMSYKVALTENITVEGIMEIFIEILFEEMSQKAEIVENEANEDK
jgi:xanthine/uracil permease